MHVPAPMKAKIGQAVKYHPALSLSGSSRNLNSLPAGPWKAKVTKVYPPGVGVFGQVDLVVKLPPNIVGIKKLTLTRVPDIRGKDEGGYWT